MLFINIATLAAVAAVASAAPTPTIRRNLRVLDTYSSDSMQCSKDAADELEWCAGAFDRAGNNNVVASALWEDPSSFISLSEWVLEQDFNEWVSSGFLKDSDAETRAFVKASICRVEFRPCDMSDEDVEQSSFIDKFGKKPLRGAVCLADRERMETFDPDRNLLELMDMPPLEVGFFEDTPFSANDAESSCYLDDWEHSDVDGGEGGDDDLTGSEGSEAGSRTVASAALAVAVAIVATVA